MDAPCAHIDASVSKAISTLRPISLTGLFGGDTAVAAMGTVHLFAHRWICRWYNTPGSYEIAKRYGQLANVWFWDGLFPGGTHDPSELFKLNGMKGPPFLGRALERPSSILVACCSFLLLGQFVTQLLIIPLGTPPGQVLYIFSLAASWLYNAYLASHNREDIQTEILFKMLRVEEGRICKVRCDFRTPMAVFTALVLQGHSRAADPKPSASSTSSAPSPDPSPDDVPYLLPYSDKHLQVENGRTLRIALQNPTKILNGIIPNDTKVWTDWKKHVGKAITRTLYPDQGGPLNPAAGWSDIPSTSSGAETASGTRPSPVEEEERLIRRLYGYANDGQRMYHAWLEWCASRTHT
ncbi:hypothetical protein GSI_05280 [Ganoderma sinense ZZ0214-1]|uniref:Uncharacterized protein n=1 Tax=Ganoderma sinense ZZ0214-1 TaxID=1077348 RepID=A0A2G8SFV0_9APHY|nr:hypothetical protein GSI_05280 [Ganoderma sinense ZZ0214-1]